MMSAWKAWWAELTNYKYDAGRSQNINNMAFMKLKFRDFLTFNPYHGMTETLIPVQYQNFKRYLKVLSEII